MSFICHIHNYTEYNEEWNVFSAFNPSKWSSGQPTLQRPGSSLGFGALLKGLTSVMDTSCRSRSREVASEDRYTVVIKGWTWSATILRLAVAFKWCSIGTKGPKVCKENIPHTITPPPAWTIETCSLCQILTLPSECRSRNRHSSD